MRVLKLPGMSESFKAYYMWVALRKFMFFLDPHRLRNSYNFFLIFSGRISILSLLLSPILTEMFELRDPELPDEYAKLNWFSMYSAAHLYNQYLALDLDLDGMLSREEIGKYKDHAISPMFLDRLFQECLMFDMKMVILNGFFESQGF